MSEDSKTEKVEKAKTKAAESTAEYPQPSNEEYLSYYVYQGEWKPTRPIRPIGSMHASPGPAIVNLPTTIGGEKHDPTRPRAPGYKIGHRLEVSDGKSKFGPGPGAYDIRDVTNKGVENSKAPKMGKADRFTDRNPLIGTSPGPAAYDRQHGDKIIYPAGPSFTMRSGERGKTRPITTPGPNAYNLPSALGPGKTPYVVGPAFSQGKAERLPDIKRQQNPGPAAYLLPSSNVNMKKGPSFSMGSKAAPPRGASWSPGPAAHGAHLVKFDKYSTPRITFGIRHSPYKAMPGFAEER